MDAPVNPEARLVAALARHLVSPSEKFENVDQLE